MPSTPVPSPAMLTGRHVSMAGTANASTVMTSQETAPTAITRHGSSRPVGSGGGTGGSAEAEGSSEDIAFQGNRLVFGPSSGRFVRSGAISLRIVCEVKDVDSRLASDLSLAVVRLARQLRFRRVESLVSLSQLSALMTLHKEGAMTPGALAIRERVRPPSMTRVITSLTELGLVARTADPLDRRQVLVSVLDAGVDLIEAERRASQEWLLRRLSTLNRDERATLLRAADLMSAIVDESA